MERTPSDEKPQELEARQFPQARLLFLYLGRRGAMARFTFEAMHAASTLPELQASLCVSRQNENIAMYSGFGPDLIATDTFSHHAGALLAAWRIPLIGRRLAKEIRRRRVTVVVDLMPHVWSSFLVPYIHKAGAKYVAIAHDAEAHIGDATGLVKGVTDLALRRADTVLTLSQSVAKGLQRSGAVTKERIKTLFLPLLSYRAPRLSAWRGERPLRVLFFGRIMPYKGLPLFVDALEALKASGCHVEAGVFGEGELGLEATRLTALGAKVENRWLSDDEIASMFEHYDLAVVSHIEASQSGVVAAAFGAGLPVVATPVGGLPEQVTHGVNGLVAAEISAQAVSAAIERIALEEGLYEALSLGVRDQLNEYTMPRFVGELARLAATEASLR